MDSLFLLFLTQVTRKKSKKIPIHDLRRIMDGDFLCTHFTININDLFRQIGKSDGSH